MGIIYSELLRHSKKARSLFVKCILIILHVSERTTYCSINWAPIISIVISDRIVLLISSSRSHTMHS